MARHSTTDADTASRFAMNGENTGYRRSLLYSYILANVGALGLPDTRGEKA